MPALFSGRDLMRNKCCERSRWWLLLWSLLSLIVLSGFLHAQEIQSDRDHFRVRLKSPTTPSRGIPEVTQITLTGIGFQDGILESNDVLISLAPEPRSAGPSESTHPTSVTSVGDRTRRLSFVIPLSIAVAKPSEYRVKISGRYCDGRSFNTVNWANLTVEPLPPALSSVSPNSGEPGSSLSVAVTGKFTHFVTGKTRASFGPEISVGDEEKAPFGPVTVNSQTSLTAQIRIDTKAPPGQRAIVVVTGDEKVTLSDGFTVTKPIPPPVANPGRPYNGNVGQSITFDGSQSTAPNGQTLTYAWDFGDNSTGSGVAPTHAYSAAGTFTVSLTVTDTSGGTNTATTVATVIPLPVAKPGGPYNGNVGQSITFDGSQSTAPNGQTLRYAWDFGDSSTGSGVTPTHAYSAAGTFTVSLTVTDTSGGTNTATTVATVIPLPVAKPGGPYNGNVGQTITFDGSQSTAPNGQTLTYSWDFGDNSTGSGVAPTHAYSAAGTFTVSLTVTDTSRGTNTATALVVVNEIVPNVVGLTQAAATTAITGAKLTVGTVTQQPSTTVPTGNVISQDPASGSSVAEGSPVSLVISSGPLVTVPNVVGLTQAAATTAITGAKLTVGTVTQQTSTTVPAGNIVSQAPAAGTSVAPGSPVNLVTGLPPDPSTVAPPVDTSVATTIGSSTTFLYSGTNPIQTGVAPKTILPTRAAVLRGKVLDKTNAPLPGVIITVLNHPEFGQTLSRADGMFDMAVNGGGPLTCQLRQDRVSLRPAAGAGALAGLRFYTRCYPHPTRRSSHGRRPHLQHTHPGRAWQRRDRQRRHPPGNAALPTGHTGHHGDARWQHPAHHELKRTGYGV